ncbi:MAG: two-component system, sensor histidine kinase and response regulator [Phycisphaerales bacterium]|nr:two-component system, sensor histidine kinase and response regulator [Phycisphaerales bacterium]
MSRKVLIVDDNADQGRPLALILRHSGYEAQFVTSGEAALMKVREEPVGLMIVDMMMPGMNGLEVLRHVRDNPQTQNIPVVIYSACSEERQMARARNAGANDYWVKVSMRLDEICRRIEGYFDGGDVRRPN